MIDDHLNKKYMLVSSSNFDVFMKELGVDEVTRKLGNTVSSIVDLRKQGEEYIFTIFNVVKSIEVKFIPGVEFNRETLDGRKIKSVITLDRNTMLEIQDGDKTVIILREFTDNGIICTLNTGDVKATRVYKKLGADRHITSELHQA